MLRNSVHVCIAALLATAGLRAHADPRDDLTEYFRRGEQYGFSGTVLVARGDEELLDGAYGYADHAKGRHAAVGTAFEVGSLTKQFTAAAILHLESNGKVSTENSISEYLDFVPDDKKAITLEHLLTHTSGLGDSYWDQHRSLTEDEYLRQTLEKPLIAPPGEQFRYSNFGYHLLKAIIERVSGMDYETYLRENLFLPCGMEHTGFHKPNWDEGQVAQYQDWATRGSNIQVQDPLKRPIFLQPEGSGGILSTTRDLYRWHRALLDNTVLSAEATTRMFTPHLSNYGYGWRISKTARGTKLIEHGGYDSWLGTVAGFYRFVDEDLVVLMLANTNLNGTLRHDLMVHQIECMIFDKPFSMPPEPRPIDPAALASYTGVYTVAPEVTIEVSVRNDHLMASTKSPAAIRALMFPNSGEPLNRKTQDTELTLLLEALVKGKFDAGSFAIDPRLDVDRFVRTWTDRVKRWKQDRGKLKRIREVHSHDYVFQGDPEMHHYAYLEFAKGQEILRAIRTDAGWVALAVFGLPDQLELTLAPTGDHEFHAWDFRLGIGPKLTFATDTPQELRIEGDRAITIAKK